MTRSTIIERSDKLTAEELRLYFLGWQDSLAEVERLKSLKSSPAVERALKRAQADEEYDRLLYLRLRQAHLTHKAGNE
jgi:hypothetical protein